MLTLARFYFYHLQGKQLKCHSECTILKLLCLGESLILHICCNNIIHFRLEQITPLFCYEYCKVVVNLESASCSVVTCIAVETARSGDTSEWPLGLRCTNGQWHSPRRSEIYLSALRRHSNPRSQRRWRMFHSEGKYL